MSTKALESKKKRQTETGHTVSAKGAVRGDQTLPWQLFAGQQDLVGEVIM